MFRRASETNPNEPAIWHNLGKVSFEALRVDEAETYFRRALKLKPDYSLSLDGLGMIGLNRCDYDMARVYCKRALEQNKECIESKVNLGMCNLAHRNWKDGWVGYNTNVGIDGNRTTRTYNKETPWKGEKGKIVVVRGEQGIGDEISFASCLPDLIRDSSKVVLDCDGRLKRLFKRSFPEVEVHGNRYQTDDQDWHKSADFDHGVLLGQLPEFYRNKDEDFPGTPYLTPNPEVQVQWRALFDSLGPEPKVGISWVGGSHKTGRHRRSVTLESLVPLLKLPCHWISLQYQDPSDEIRAVEDKFGVKVHHWPHGVQIFDYDITTALIAELDLVISVTTTAIHAAAGLGKECWCLVSEKPMWRYGVKGDDFPWGSSVKLFRQKSGQWPIQVLATALKEWMSK